MIAIGDLPFLYFWFRNGEWIEEVLDPVLVLDPFDELMAGTYDVLVINAAGVAAAATYVLIPDIANLPFTAAFDARPGGQGPFPNGIVGLEGSGRGSNVGATLQRRSGGPDHAILPGGRSVWVTWTPEVTGIAAMATTGSSFDTVMAVYRARDSARPTLDSLIEVASSDDSEFGSINGLPPDSSSLVFFNARAGTPYFVAVDGFGIAGDAGPLFDEFSEEGNSVLSWALEETDPLIPDFLANLTDQNVDPGGGLNLDGRVDPTTAERTEWQWWLDGQPVPGLTGNQLNLPEVSRNQVGTYFCETWNRYGKTIRSARSNGGGGADHGAQRWDGQEPAGRGPIRGGPAGPPVQFSVVASGIGTMTYQWRKGGQPIAGANQPEFRIAAASVNDVGEDSVVVSDDTGSVTSAGTQLTLASPVTVRLALSRISGTEVRLNGNAPAGQTWRIDSSTELRSWSPSVSETATTTGFEVNQALQPGEGPVMFRAVRP